MTTKVVNFWTTFGKLFQTNTLSDLTDLRKFDTITIIWKWRDNRSKLWTFEEWKNNWGSSPHKNQPNNDDMIKMQLSMWGTFK